MIIYIRSANRQQPSQSTTNQVQRSYSSRQSYQQQDRSYAGAVRNNPTTQQGNRGNAQSYYRDSGTYPNKRRQGQILTNNRNQIQENTSANQVNFWTGAYSRTGKDSDSRQKAGTNNQSFKKKIISRRNKYCRKRFKILSYPPESEY